MTTFLQFLGAGCYLMLGGAVAFVLVYLLFGRTKGHFDRHRGFYGLLPVTVGLVLAAHWWVWVLSGRTTVEQPDVVVGLAWQVMRCAVAIALAGWVKNDRKLNRDFGMNWGETLCTRQMTGMEMNARTWEMLISRAFTVGLLVVFLWALGR